MQELSPVQVLNLLARFHAKAVEGLWNPTDASTPETSHFSDFDGYPKPWRNAAGWFSGYSVLAAMLVGVADFLALGESIAALAWWVRRNESSLEAAMAKLLRRPLLAGIALCLLLLLIAGPTYAGLVLLSRYYGPSAVAGIAYSTGLARLFLDLAQTPAPAFLTVLPLRPRFPQTATTVPS